VDLPEAAKLQIERDSEKQNGLQNVRIPTVSKREDRVDDDKEGEGEGAGREQLDGRNIF
jgi:hypothetical protein